MLPRFCLICSAMFLAGCGSKEGSDEGPKEPATTEDGRWILSVSDRGFVVKGAPVRVGQTTMAELEKAIGAPDRVVDPLKLGGAFRFGLWDKRGLRANFLAHSGRIDHFDCEFDSILAPEAPIRPQDFFHDVLKVDGVEITGEMTQDALQQKFKGKFIPEARFPAFSLKLGQHTVSVNFGSETKTLQYVRIQLRDR